MAADAANTVEYFLHQEATQVASATNISSASKTVRVEEGPTDRTIRSVFLEVWGTFTAVTMTAATLGITIDAHTEATVSLGTGGDIVVATGEDYTHRLIADFTSEFVTNFDGNSHAIVARVNITGPQSSGIAMKLHITYDFDSADTTQTKTIKIFVGSEIAELQTPNPAAGSYSIPNLDTYIPDHLGTPTYNSIWIELWGGLQSDQTDATIQTNFDGGGAATLGIVEASSKLYMNWRMYYDRSSMTTNATHTLVVTDSGATGVDRLAAFLCVTYRWDPSATTHIKTVEYLIGQEGAGLGDTSELTLQNAAVYIPETSPVTKSIFVCVGGAHEKLSGTLTVKLQAEVSGGVYVTDNALKDNHCWMIRDATALVTLSVGNNTLTAKVTNSVANLMQGRYALAFVTYNYAGSSTEILRMVRYMVATDDDDDSLTIEQAKSLSIPGGGKPRGGHMFHFAENAHTQSTRAEASNTPTIDAVEGPVPSYTSDKEGLIILNYQDVLDALTEQNIAASHTYKNVGSHLEQFDQLEVTVVYNNKIGDIAGITKDKDGTALGSVRVALFKNLGGSPPTYEYMDAQISHVTTGAYSFPIFSSGNYMIYAEKDDTPHVFDASDNVLVAV